MELGMHAVLPLSSMHCFQEIGSVLSHLPGRNHSLSASSLAACHEFVQLQKSLDRLRGLNICICPAFRGRAFKGLGFLACFCSGLTQHPFGLGRDVPGQGPLGHVLVGDVPDMRKLLLQSFQDKPGHCPEDTGDQKGMRAVVAIL